MATESSLFLWTSVFLLASGVSSNTISLSPSDSIENLEFQAYFGCDGESKLTSDTVVEIVGGRNYTLFEGPMFCVLSNLNNITIRSNTSEQAVLWCPGSEKSMTRNQTGFGFYNMSNLTLENIRIDNCGGIVDERLLEDRPGVNTFGENQQAVITIAMSTDIQLLNIEITNYLGYAIIGNTVLGEFRIDKLSVKQSHAFNTMPMDKSLINNDSLLVGSGILLRYIDTDMSKHTDQTTICISSAVLVDNRNLLPTASLEKLQNIETLTRKSGYVQIPCGGSGVIHIGFSNKEYDVKFALKQAIIRDNFGSIGGGITLAHVDSNIRSEVTIEDCFISNNTNYFKSGSGIQMYYEFNDNHLHSWEDSQMSTSSLHSVFIVNTVIENNFSPTDGGGFSAIVEAQNIADISLYFINTTFTKNKAQQYGDCLLLLHRKHYSIFSSKNFHVYLNSTKVTENGYFRTNTDTKSSCVYANGVNKLIVSGSEEREALFSGHNTSVLLTVNSFVYLNGFVTFENNRGLRGGALSLSFNSHLIFVNKSHIVFSNNSADEYGGAIYINSISRMECEIQFLPSITEQESNQIILDLHEIDNYNYSIVFSNNHARTGNSIYGTHIYNCTPYAQAIVQSPENNVDKLYRSLFNFSGSSFLNEVRSQPHKVCHCNIGSNPTCLDLRNDVEPIKAFPGFQFSVSVMVVDVTNQPVHANLYADVMYREENDVRLRRSQQLVEVDGNCSLVPYAFITSTENITAKILLRTKNYDFDSTITISVFIHACPAGFTVDEDICDCITLYNDNNHFCNSTSCTIQRANGEWLGMFPTENGDVPAHYYTCPIGYCNNSTMVNLSAEYPVCAEHRVGVVCGRCEEGFSNVFGSMACKAGCTSWWLFSIFVYMIIGILLVLVIDKLDLTVTNGTINGIVFYAQMTAITINISSIDRNTHYVARLVRFINLELGIPIELCFYKGMTALSKYVLQFLFPAYLGFIVIFTVLLSKCNKIEKKINFSNSVNIMVTLIYLSYGKILTTIVFLLTPLPLQVEQETGKISDHLVWYYDGMEGYFQGNHLMIGIIAVVIFLFFIIPYQFLILFSQWCLKFRFFAYYLPVVDANVAPFKHKYRFWFGMRLIITAVLIVVSASLSPYYHFLVFLVNTFVLTCLLVTQAFLQPYKSIGLNILDLSFILNLTLLYVITLYFQFAEHDGNQLLESLVSSDEVYLAYERFSAILALLTFAGIIVYHITKCIKKSKYYKKMKRDVKSVPTTSVNLDEGEELQNFQRVRHDSRFSSSLYSRFRESVLEL